MSDADSTIVGDRACPNCTANGRDKTGNHLMLFENKTAYCNRCDYYVKDWTLLEDEKDNRSFDYQPSSLDKLKEIETYPFRQLTDRRITKDTCEYYGVRVSLSQTDGQTITHHYYPIYTESNEQQELSGYKVRHVADKQFFLIGSAKKPILFGQNKCTPGGKKLYITEGELDCLTVFQCLKENQSSQYKDINPQVVSIVNGSSSAAKAIKDNYEFVNSFDQVIFVFDNDEPGNKAVQEACKLLPTKSYYVKLPLKDPSDMYKAGRGEELKWLCVKDHIKYKSEKIINDPKELWKAYQEEKNKEYIPFPWPKLNIMAYGIRPGNLYTFTSGTGMGKSQYLRELKDYWFRTTDFKIADIALEESTGTTVQGMMRLYLGKRIGLPGVDVTEEEELEAFNYYYAAERFSLYDQRTGLDDSGLLPKIEEFAKTDHKIIFLDHLTMVVDETSSNKSEYEKLNLVMNKLERMAKDLDVAIILVVHLRKSSTFEKINGVTRNISFEEGAIPTLDDLKGSSAIKQCSSLVLAISRNQQHYDSVCANTSLISLLKNRHSGVTGKADYIFFDHATGRLSVTSKPYNYELR